MLCQRLNRLCPNSCHLLTLPDFEIKSPNCDGIGGGSHGKVKISTVGDGGQRLTGTAPSAPASKAFSSLSPNELCSTVLSYRSNRRLRRSQTGSKAGKRCLCRGSQQWLLTSHR